MLAVRSWLPVKGNVNPAYTVLEDVVFTLLALHQLLTCLAVLHPVDDQDVARILQAALARSQALVSGELEFHASYSAGGQFEDDLMGVFQGEDWFKRSSTGAMILNFAGKHLTYAPNPQADGSFVPQARVYSGGSRPMDSSTSHPPIPVRAGSFWLPSVPRYLVAHANRVRKCGTEEVSGLACVKLELDVPGKDASAAYHGVNSFVENGSTITIWLAPEQGYVVPQLEIRSPEGYLFLGTYGEGFRNVGNEIWMPETWRILKQNPSNPRIPPTLFLEYKISKFARINEPIPVELFQVDMPVGTGVVDERPNAEGKRAALFGIGVPSSPGERVAHDLAPVVPNLYPRAAPEDSSSSLWSVGIGVGAVVLVLLLGLAGAAYFYFRRRSAAAPAG